MLLFLVTKSKVDRTAYVHRTPILLESDTQSGHHVSILGYWTLKLPNARFQGPVHIDTVLTLGYDLLIYPEMICMTSCYYQLYYGIMIVSFGIISGSSCFCLHDIIIVKMVLGLQSTCI